MGKGTAGLLFYHERLYPQTRRNKVTEMLGINWHICYFLKQECFHTFCIDKERDNNQLVIVPRGQDLRSITSDEDN